jgi:ribosomal-protein-alanine N-acetyltransferase
MGYRCSMHVVPDIKLASARDAEDIAAMSRDFIEQGLGWSWTAARVLRAICHSGTNVAIAREGNIAMAREGNMTSAREGELEAFGIMHYGDESAHLSLLAVRPAARRKGLATLLLAWLEHSARVAGMECIRLEARADNPQALAFYLHCGFSPVASVPGYYQGAIDALRFEKRLSLRA